MVEAADQKVEHGGCALVRVSVIGQVPGHAADVLDDGL
jgi:hypothetical protein